MILPVLCKSRESKRGAQKTSTRCTGGTADHSQNKTVNWRLTPKPSIHLLDSHVDSMSRRRHASKATVAMALCTRTACTGAHVPHLHSTRLGINWHQNNNISRQFSNMNNCYLSLRPPDASRALVPWSLLWRAQQDPMLVLRWCKPAPCACACALAMLRTLQRSLHIAALLTLSYAKPVPSMRAHHQACSAFW